MEKRDNYKTVKRVGFVLFLILIIAVIYVFYIKKMPTIYDEINITEEEYENFIESKSEAEESQENVTEEPASETPEENTARIRAFTNS